MRVEGTMTVIGYFTDRLLLIGEIELRSEDALIFMTSLVYKVQVKPGLHMLSLKIMPLIVIKSY